MATFPLRNLHLNLSNVARTTNAKSMPVNGVNKIYERGADGQKTEQLKSLLVDCSGYRGATLSVKFPVEIKDKFDELEKQLENDVTIEIAFTGKANVGKSSLINALVNSKSVA